jgi:hypothetical protein
MCKYLYEDFTFDFIMQRLITASLSSNSGGGGRKGKRYGAQQERDENRDK